VASGGGLQGWKGPKQVILGLVGLGMPLRVEEMHFSASGTSSARPTWSGA
jgi:hypothetical protein